METPQDLQFKAASITRLSSHALIRVSGTAAASFLQGQLSCDINQLEKASSLGAHCNTKGRVRALYRVFRLDEDFYLRCPRSLLDKALSFLQFYARFSKVRLTPIENPIGFGIIIPTAGTRALPFPPLADNGVTQIDEYTLLRVPGNTEWDRYEVYRVTDTGKNSSHASTIQSWISDLSPLSENQWAISNILVGIPDIFPETSEQFLPHYIGLPQLGAISFTKGCYIGQEIIARMEYRSKQHKYHLALVKTNIDSPDALRKPGETLSDRISVCVASAQAPDQHTAYLLVQEPASQE